MDKDKPSLELQLDGYRALVEQIPAVTYIAALDEISTTIYFSPQIEALLGFSPGEWTDDPDLFRKQLHPDDRERVMAELARSRASGEPFVTEYRLLARDGSAVWFRDEAVVVRDAAGSPLFLQGVMFDVTERRRAEEELKKHRERLEELVAERTAELTRANERLQEEVAERKRAEEELQYRVELQRLITSLSTHFINLAPGALDGEITRALQAIGEFAGDDRSYICLFSGDGAKMTSTHEWCAAGIEAQIDNLKDVPVTALPRIMEKLSRLETLYVPRVAEFAPDGDAEKELLQAQDIQSFILVPMAYGGSLVGFLGFDAVRTEKSWSEEAIVLLRIVGEILANALERRQVEEEIRRLNEELERRVIERTTELREREEELRRRVGQLTALSSASQAVTASLELVPVLNNIVSLARDVTDADYASVVLADEEGNLVHGAEIEPDVPDASRRARSEGYTHWIVRSRQAVVVDDVAEDGAVIPQAPAGAPRTINPYFVAVGLKSFTGLPLVARERLLGVLCLESSRPYHFHDQLPLLSTFANQAAIAIENARLFEAERAARERMQALSRRLVEVQESERGYVARELHDGAGQALAYLMVTLGRLEQQAGHPDAVAALVVELQRATQGVWDDLRRLALGLHPPNLERLGLAAALRQYIEDFSSQHGQVVEFEALGFDDVRLPPEVETALYRIVQEALTNTARHAWARRVEVRLELNGDRATAVVRDNGVGFEPGAEERDGLGLVSMRERAEMLGGDLVVESAIGAGTTVSVEIPL